VKRILVIGGAGFYGARVVAAVKRIDDVEVSIGGRSVEGGARRLDGGAGEGVRIDLGDAATFGALDGFDVVVNCSDTVRAPPDALASHCLRQGLTLFDMGADPPTTERLLQLDSEGARGFVVVGAGIFPGISTVLAQAAAEAVADCQSIDVGVRLSPLSGAGPGNCALMTEMLRSPSFWYEDGERHEAGPVGPPTRLPYLGIGERVSLRVALPDVALVRRSAGPPTVRASMALVPSFLRFNFGLLGALLPRMGPLRRPLLALTEWSLRFFRGLLLRGVKSAVELTAVANRGGPDEQLRMLAFADGQEGTALGVAAMVELWLGRSELPPPGVYAPGDLFALGELMAAVRRLAGDGAEIAEGSAPATLRAASR
jgi:hypothetical protein